MVAAIAKPTAAARFGHGGGNSYDHGNNRGGREEERGLTTVAEKAWGRWRSSGGVDRGGGPRSPEDEDEVRVVLQGPGLENMIGEEGVEAGGRSCTETW